MLGSRRVSVLLTALALAVTTGCSSSDKAVSSAGNDVKVIANFYPVQWLAENVGRDVVHVTSVTPPGVEPHDSVLDAKAVSSLRDANLVLYMGDGFQPEVEDAVNKLPSSVKRDDVLESPGLQLLRSGEEQGSNDPHVWLDPVRMKAIAEDIATALKTVAPSQVAKIDSNLAATNAELDALHLTMKQKLSDCAEKTIVTSHAAFQYLADRYQLTQVPIAGISPDSEPSAKELQDIAAIAKSRNVSTVYFEENLPSNVAATVAKEIGAKTDVLSPLEFNPADNNGSGNYVSVQKDNAERLNKGLRCSP